MVCKCKKTNILEHTSIQIDNESLILSAKDENAPMLAEADVNF